MNVRSAVRWLSLLCLALAGVLFVTARSVEHGTLPTGQIVPLPLSLLNVLVATSLCCVMLSGVLYTLTEPQWRWWAVIWGTIVVEFGAMAGVAMWQHTPLGYVCAVVVALTWVGGLWWLVAGVGSRTLLSPGYEPGEETVSPSRH